MAQPYLSAIHHSEWHAKNVLKKFQRNRPLGDIELQHRYKPAKPVLSSKTVDIDCWGTRTYRAKNTIDIIEEQHKLIHEIYSKARKISSAPPTGNRSKPKYVHPQEAVKGLQTLRVTGANTTDGRRPDSAKTDFIILKTRPNTTGSHKRRAQAAIDTELRIDVTEDADWQASSDAYHSTRQQIRHGWQPEKRTLDEGQFVRGRKDQPSVTSSLDPRAASGNWLSFSGGQQGRSAGVVEAFTAMKHDGHFYSIDGSTGSAVARQLQRGDKIRIGVNGQAAPADYRLREHQQNVQDDAASLNDSALKTSSQPIVPLSWSDQVQREDTIIRQPSLPRQPEQKPNLNETKPVIFKKFGVEGTRPPLLSTPPSSSSQKQKHNVRVVEGYNVSRRSSTRPHMNGSRALPASRVTHVSIDKQAFEDLGKGMSYDEILEMRIDSKSSLVGPLMHDVVQEAENVMQDNVAEQVSREPRISDIRSVNSPSTPHPATTAAATAIATGVATGTKVRPKSTISSSGATDFHGWVVGATTTDDTAPVPTLLGSGSKHDDSTGSGRSVGRRLKSGGATRPPPHKPTLHKTAAASGTSIGSGRARADSQTEYINMAHPMTTRKDLEPAAADEPTDAKSRGTSRSDNNTIIRSVSDYNKPRGVSDKDVTFKDELAEIIPDDVYSGSLQNIDSVDISSDTMNVVAATLWSNSDAAALLAGNNDDDGGGDESVADVAEKYAFEIPTAEPDATEADATAAPHVTSP